MSSESMHMKVNKSDWRSTYDLQRVFFLKIIFKPFNIRFLVNKHLYKLLMHNPVFIYKLMSLVARKPVFGVSDHLRLKRAAQLQKLARVEFLGKASRGINTVHAVNNKGADQTARMRRLICAFVVHIRHKQVFSWWGSYEGEHNLQWSGLKHLRQANAVNTCKMHFLNASGKRSHTSELIRK